MAAASLDRRVLAMTMLVRLERKDDDDDALDRLYDQDAEQTALAFVIERRYAAMLRAMHTLLGDVFQLGEDFRLTDADTDALLQVAAERVVMIDTATRNAIREQLAVGNRLGLSTWEIAFGKPDIGYAGLAGLYEETWRNRSLTIARTEIQTAQILSAQDRYRASGLVDRMRIVDGDYDAECAARNGRVVPVGQNVDLLHPNCRATVIPVLREGVI